MLLALPLALAFLSRACTSSGCCQTMSKGKGSSSGGRGEEGGGGGGGPRGWGGVGWGVGCGQDLNGSEAFGG